MSDQVTPNGSAGAPPYPSGLPHPSVSSPPSLSERAVVALAVASTLVMAFANLDVPSLWHDELIHVYVGKRILETGMPLLLSGRVFTNGTLFNYLLAGVIALFGDGEAAVRSPSAFFGVVNVYVTYRVLRPLVGGPAAALTALLMAWSPWQLAWARQARFYMLHQTVYLVAILLVWRFGHADRSRIWRWVVGVAAVYGIGLLAGPQTVFFLGPIGAYAACRWIGARSIRSRWTALILMCAVLGAATLLGYYVSLPKAEHDAMFKEALKRDVPDEAMIDHDQSDLLYYFRFYTNNLGSGYFLLACVGLALLVSRGGKGGLLVTVAFVAPLLALNFGIPMNRRYRFLFFAYPFYVAACAYAMVFLARFVRTSRQSAWRIAAALAFLVFAGRLAVSQYRLAKDCLEVAGGDSTTLAVHHPQWRQPCAYVKEHCGDAAVLCTTYIAALYYVGKIDDWYPSRVIVWEYIESGMDGMRTLEELQAFVSAHPRGYFIAEHRRFHMWPIFFKDDIEWVEANMKRIDEASNSDITVYSWGV